MVVYAASDSPWARRRKMSLADLIDAPWILPFYNNPAGRLIVEAFKASGFEPPKARVKTFTIDIVLGLLATGRYVSIGPRSMLRMCANRLSLKILPIKLQHQASSVAIMTLKGRTLSPVAELFIKYAREAAKPFAAAG